MGTADCVKKYFSHFSVILRRTVLTVLTKNPDWFEIQILRGSNFYCSSQDDKIAVLL